MNKVLKEKIIEAFTSVLPITLIVLAASVILVPMPSGTILMFLAGALMLIVGMGFFTLGADMAMMPIGEGIGVQLTKKTNLVLAIFISFLIGLIITIAEPDLQVLAEQVSSIPGRVLIVTVGVGVGLFLALSVVRILFRIPLPLMLLVFYVIVFTISGFTPDNFIPMAFDSGGVTTGPITVPFMLSMGLGFAAIRGDKSSREDSFGFVALCSVGPILAVLVLGAFYNPTGPDTGLSAVPGAETSRDVVLNFMARLPVYLKEVCFALGAIIVFFLIFQLVFRRYQKHQLARIAVGFFYTLVGLVVFLTGVNVGFIPVGHAFGSQLAASSLKWILVPLGMLIGYFIVAAEPAVHVLNKQVEDVSQGAIPQKVMNLGLSIGMAAALGITMVRILTGLHIMWFLIPGYAFSLVLTFFVPRIFTGIAFDSGGVCSGPMTSTFLLPLAMGACEGAGGNLMTDAFGIVAMVAMTPLIVIQLVGLLYRHKLRAFEFIEPEKKFTGDPGAITEYPFEYEGARIYE
ncbi:MAG: DUF1538 domain-containing protein [Spirochaetales bacterium]|jgi:hypothetical protein|nr:DUF1538 domain-containing protein [Spirochaetales bacterium]